MLNTLESSPPSSRFECATWKRHFAVKMFRSRDTHGTGAILRGAGQFLCCQLENSWFPTSRSSIAQANRPREPLLLHDLTGSPACEWLGSQHADGEGIAAAPQVET